MFCLDISNITT